MKVLHVCSEFYPLLKTGGLADVLGALPFAQQKNGIDARVVLPAYPQIKAGFSHTDVVNEFDNFAGHVVLRYGEFNGLGIYLIDAPHLYERWGSPYHDSNYQAYADNYLRFALLGWIGAGLAMGLDHLWYAELVHSHDWHAGLTSAYLASRGSTAKTVFTVHNLAFAGMFDARHIWEIDLPPYMMDVNGLEFYGQISYLKAGLYYSDRVTAVSPTYAREITTDEFGYGFQGLLQGLQREGRLSGILNGVDYNIWDPASDNYLKDHYKLKNMAGKKKNKASLQASFNLPQKPDVPVFVMISRLTEQKGIDLVLEAVDDLVEQGGQLIILGSGADYYEQDLYSLAQKYPHNVGVKIGYDEPFSHLLVAGGDVILVPSRFEPCGLTQLYGLKYGTLPLVRRTGGLADTVVAINSENIKNRVATGFIFDYADVNSFKRAVHEAFELWKKQRLWFSVRSVAMEQDFSWAISAKNYSNLYQSI